MKCYGNYKSKSKRCSVCELKKFCEESLDPELLDSRMTTFENIEYAEEYACEQAPPSDEARNKTELMCYSRLDMLEMISFMVCMDSQTLHMLDQKLNNPSVNFSDMARNMKISRQAVHKFIKKRCEEIPELEPLLRNRQNKLKQGGTTNFMEAVCQIRQTSGKKLEKRNTNSNCSGILKSLTRNLDLSRMSIYRGARSCVID
ncbi:MAG: hypothetical protein JXR78_02580 [Victivallales bacterium]|nr:hypothetical protein [Victivallales bacterium]